MNDQNEQNDKNFSADSNGTISSDAQPICSQCLQPGGTLQYYCANCGSNDPLNPLASYMPFVRIRFTAGMFGKLWRRALNKETSMAMKVFSLLLIGLGAPVMLTVGLPFLLISKIKDDKLRKIVTVAFIVILVAVIAIRAALI